MSFTKLTYHIVYGTQDRRPLMDAELLPRLVKYLGGIIRELDGSMIEANGPEDHLHIVTILSPKLALTDCLRIIKTNLSRWVHASFPDRHDFGWQDGYAAFSVSHSQLAEVVRYVRGQQEHHKKMSFEEELAALLKKHDVEFDPKYIMG